MKFLNKVYNFFEGFNASINGYNFCPEKKNRSCKTLYVFFKNWTWKLFRSEFSISRIFSLFTRLKRVVYFGLKLVFTCTSPSGINFQIKAYSSFFFNFTRFRFDLIIIVNFKEAFHLVVFSRQSAVRVSPWDVKLRSKLRILSHL